MPVPYDQGRPIWVDDDRFDITYHVRHTALPKPGSWEQLVALDDARAGAAARPRAAALGAVVRRRARGRQRRAHPEDAPRADRRRVGRRRRDAAARHEPRVRARRSSPSGRPSPRRARRSCCSTRLRERADRAGRDRAFGAVDAARAAARASSEPASSRESMSTMVTRDVDRAAHVDQRAHRPAPAAVGRAGPARRREGRSGAGSAAPSTTSCSPVSPAGCAGCSQHRGDDDRRTCSCACCARCRCAPTTSAARSATRSRRCSCRCRSTDRPGRTAARDLGADRRPQGAAAGRRRRASCST